MNDHLLVQKRKNYRLGNRIAKRNTRSDIKSGGGTILRNSSIPLFLTYQTANLIFFILAFGSSENQRKN